MTRQHDIIAILTLCLLLGIAGTRMDVSAMAEENPIAAEENTVAPEETNPEPIPMMAQRSCNDDYSHYRDYDGLTFQNTDQGLYAMNIAFGGSGRGVILSDHFSCC
jgi:hypothetical protein